MCVIPAAAGLFGNKVQGAALGGLAGGIPGALIGAKLAKHKTTGPISEAGARPASPTIGPSPSYGA